MINGIIHQEPSLSFNGRSSIHTLFSATIASGFECCIVSPNASLSCKKLKNAVLTKEANDAASSASGESAFVCWIKGSKRTWKSYILVQRNATALPTHFKTSLDKYILLKSCQMRNCEAFLCVFLRLVLLLFSWALRSPTSLSPLVSALLCTEFWQCCTCNVLNL